jgi:hypothetical protein
MSNGLVVDRLPRMSFADQSSMMEDRQVVGEFGGQVEIVEDCQHRPAEAGEIAGKFQDGNLVADIKACRRLVEKDRARAIVHQWFRHLGEHTGQLNALLLAA